MSRAPGKLAGREGDACTANRSVRRLEFTSESRALHTGTIRARLARWPALEGTMPLQNVSIHRLGAPSGCRACGAGSVISFDWQYAQTAPQAEHRRDVSIFIRPAPLRYGTLYECRSCGQPWYLFGDPASMSFVPKERVELIRRWNEREIVLSTGHAAQLQAIGRTPPDVYGNRSQFHETPCAVTTVQGEQLDLSVISIQQHAPYEERRAYRLATDIAEIRPSPSALPLSIRVATSRAEEARMGFAPTLVELPSGDLIALNWTQHFFVREGCSASDVVLSTRRLDLENPPAVYNGTEGVTYFIADRAPGI